VKPPESTKRTRKRGPDECIGSVSKSIPPSFNHASKQCASGLDEPINNIGEIADHVFKCLGKSLASGRVQDLLEESVFLRMGDYWVIRYQGQAAILKATRGIDYLAYLLRHPTREIHVAELVCAQTNKSTLRIHGRLSAVSRNSVAARAQHASPILDSKAKLEYKRRIDELRKDMEEADRFNDSHRASRSRSELDALTAQLAAAVGFGGRDRRASSNAERARSAVTKRIKETINRIKGILPSLGYHLAARIKTGYMCCYNPRPDRPVAWKLLFQSH
jgi:non-specific serine/threonine protein kinase